MVDWNTLQEVGFPIATGVLGYSYNAFRNRIRPFVSLKGISGDIRRTEQQIDVPESIVTRLQSCIHLPRGISSKESIRQLALLQDKVNVLHDFGEELVRQIGDLEKALTANDRISFLNKVDEILTKRLVGDFIISMSFIEELVPQSGEESNLDPLIEYEYNAESNGGCFWVAVPGKNTWRFGDSLGGFSIAKGRLENFLRALRDFRAPAVGPFLLRLKNRLDAEVRVATAIQSDLSTLLDVHSRWEFLLNVANLGQYPFLIGSAGNCNCEVKDASTKAVNIESTNLVLVTRGESNDILRNEAPHPVVIAPGTSCEISFITTKTQREMARGAGLRELFDSGSGAKCRVSFAIEKPGFFQKKVIHTSWVPFAGSKA